MALSVTFHNQTVSVGDTIRVSQKIREGEKERIQQFQGTVIAIKGNHGERSIAVRKIAPGGIGVERVFPVDLPSISSVSVTKSAHVRRAKLYYLRKRIGEASLRLQ